jgi:hypothetical protein
VNAQTISTKIITCAALLFLGYGLSGCDTLRRVFEIFQTTQDTPLIIDRIWDIKEPNRKLLIVMVHGFNSSSDEAWGGFPKIITKEKDSTFSAFNVIRYGYESSACRNKIDISVRGDGLRSWLIDHMKNYNGALFVAHSMGGLVVMQALTFLARDHNPDLDRVPITIMTFGTPHLGLRDAEKLGELGKLCQDKQAEAMVLFGEYLLNLTAQYRSYFEDHQRYSYRVIMKKYYGADDVLVERGSACAAETLQIVNKSTAITPR